MKSDPLPIAFIAGLRRTGSKLVSSALTELPHAFVFREPRIMHGKIDLKEHDRVLLAEHGVDLRHLELTRSWRNPVIAARTFREDVLEPASARVRQFGIKEIRYGPRWREVLDELGPVRIVVLARHPRDLYISLAGRLERRGRLTLAGPFGPEAVIADLRGEMDIQREIIAERECLRVRYEDLCRRPALLEEIRTWVRSPLRTPPELGFFAEPGNDEVHAGDLSTERVERWRTEPNANLRAGADVVARELADYCEFWSYEL